MKQQSINNQFFIAKENGKISSYKKRNKTLANLIKTF